MSGPKCAQVSLWLADYISALDHSLGVSLGRRQYGEEAAKEIQANKYLARMIETRIHDMQINCGLDLSEAKQAIIKLHDDISATEWITAKNETLPSVEGKILVAIDRAIKE